MDEIDKRKTIRDAATIILLRQRQGRDQVLMGQRGASAAFMPNKYVFPGGAVDPADYHVSAAFGLTPRDADKVAKLASPDSANAVAMAAVRELWEETGLMLGSAGAASDDVPDDWRGFYDRGLVPRADVLRFMFRAITPPGRPRRFDARFFMTDAAAIVGPDDDFSEASDELSHLHWIDLDEANSLDLPFITSVVLAEVSAIRSAPQVPRGIPFFYHDETRSHFTVL